MKNKQIKYQFPYKREEVPEKLLWFYDSYSGIIEIVTDRTKLDFKYTYSSDEEETIYSKPYPCVVKRCVHAITKKSDNQPAYYFEIKRFDYEEIIEYMANKINELNSAVESLKSDISRFEFGESGHI